MVCSDERAVAYQRLRLPLTVLPSRATAIKIARELKATMIVNGTYNVTVPAASTDMSGPRSPSGHRRRRSRVRARQRRPHERRRVRRFLGARVFTISAVRSPICSV